MNILEGTLVRKDGRLVFDGGPISVPLPTGMDAALKDYAGKEVCLGLRPRSFALPEHAPSGACETVFKAVVELEEMLGEDLLVHVRCGPHAFTVSIDPHMRPSVDGEFTVCPIMSRAHIFDRKTGRNLTTPLT